MSVSEIVYGDDPPQSFTSEMSGRLNHIASPEPIEAEPDQPEFMSSPLLAQSL